MYKQIKNKKFFFALICFTILLTTGAKCENLPANQKYGKTDPITLTYWKVFEASSDISPLIGAYQQMHPYVSVNYRNLTYAEYEEQLLRALAEDRPPDIISINTTWMKRYLTYLQPMPAEVKIAYQFEKGTFKKEIYTEYRTQKTATLREVRSLFPDVVYENQIINGQIYGLPLSIDTLVLFYNKDLLNNANIATPPKTWDEFTDQVEKLTRQDTKGNIIQSGAAIGTADNIERATDILSLLMMQAGAKMSDAAGNVTFQKIPENYTRTIPPAIEALNFYTSFSSPAKKVYTWNENMENSLRAFLAQKTAFFFGYSYHLPTIKAQGINYEVAPMPQAGNPINYANYWVESVLKKSQHPDEAWDLINFMTTNEENNKKYLEANKKPSALRSLISWQSQDLDLASFSTQLLTAKSWYRGRDVDAAEEIIKTMIRDNMSGLLSPEQIINRGAQRVSQTIY